MASKQKQEAQNPLLLRCHRLMEAFAKSNEERDFYLDRMEGFIIYVDLDKQQEELDTLEKELKTNPERYCAIPKLSFYETKKIMEGFVNEKVYDIDTKEKLLDIIQSKEARENFLEFIFDHHTEYDKWQQYYQERSRIRIIEWLRNNHYHFVFEEDLDLPKLTIEKLKIQLFEPKAGKDVLAARKALISKAKTYYSTEALNPRPKRGRPPKQAAKLEIEPQITTDIYTTVPPSLRLFLFTPDISNASGITFSSKFENEEDLLAHRRHQNGADRDLELEDFNHKLASLRTISNKWVDGEASKKPKAMAQEIDFNADDDEDDDEPMAKGAGRKAHAKAPKKNESPAKSSARANKPSPPTKGAPKPTGAVQKKDGKATAAKKAAVASKKEVPAPKKKAPLRSIVKSQKPQAQSKTASTQKPLAKKKIAPKKTL